MSKTKHATVRPNLSPPVFDISTANRKRKNLTVDPNHKIKSNYRFVLKQLKKRRLKLYPDYDKKTYVCENNPISYESSSPSYDDEGCDHMFCGGTCIKIGPGTTMNKNKRL